VEPDLSGKTSSRASLAPTELRCFDKICSADRSSRIESKDPEKAPFPAGRAQVLRSGKLGKDAELAALGQGWPIAATHGVMPERGQSELREDPMEGQDFLVTFGAFAKSDPL
jgi:hypothetical protein